MIVEIINAEVDLAIVRGNANAAPGRATNVGIDPGIEPETDQGTDQGTGIVMKDATDIDMTIIPKSVRGIRNTEKSLIKSVKAGAEAGNVIEDRKGWNQTVQSKIEQFFFA